MILLMSPEQDAHTQAVRRCLELMGAAVATLDLAEFPQQAQVAFNYGARLGCYESLVSDYDRDLDLRECSVVWWRQPQPFMLHPELTDRLYRSFAYIECQATIAGLWLALDASWINHPMRSEEALRKPYQLKVAQQVGFALPATLITNNPNRARAFVQQHGVERTIYRAFSATARTWHEARLVPTQPMALLDNVCYAPVVFQEYIPAQHDLRVVVVGNELFAAVAPALAGERTTIVGELEPYPLTSALASQVRTLVTRLELGYGVVHMRIALDGQPLFIDLDPSGNWLEMEEQTGQPITQAIARLLASYERQSAGSGLAVHLHSS
jgi:hypothetical protein